MLNRWAGARWLPLRAMPSPVSRRLLWRGLLAAVVVLVIAGGAVAFVLAHAPGNVSHPNLAVHGTDDHDRAAPRRTPGGRRQLPVAVVRVRRRTDALLRRAGEAGPAAAGRLEILRRGAAGVPAGDLPRDAVRTRRQRLGPRDQCAQRTRPAGTEVIGTLCRRLADGRPAGRARAHAGAVDQRPLIPAGGTVRRAVDEERPHRVVTPRGPGQRVLARSSTATRSTSAIRAARCTPATSSNGHLYWTYHASGAIKGGPALVDGVLYFGDYAGRAYAVRAVSGRQLWAVGTSGTHFGFGSRELLRDAGGRLRARVHGQHRRPRVLVRRPERGAGLGDFDRRLRVRIGVGRPIPRVWDRRVYVGSYDGNMYAFNAQSGAVRWRHLGRRADLRLVDGDRQRRLLLRPGQRRRPAWIRVTGRPGVLIPRRRLHADHRRLPRPLPGRLRRDLPAASGPAPASPPRPKPKSPSRQPMARHQASVQKRHVSTPPAASGASSHARKRKRG